MAKSIRLYLALFIALIGYNPAWSADPIQTQMGMTGDIEAAVLKANVREGILNHRARLPQ